MTVNYEVLIKEFSEKMLKRLLEKRSKYGDSWLSVSIEQLRRRVIDEVAEWAYHTPYGFPIVLVMEAAKPKPTYNKEDEMKELIDIANQCLLLYFRLKEVKSNG